ncbi:MAG: lysophospholipid acyltransferase family protein [Eubacteriales bacterium]
MKKVLSVLDDLCHQRSHSLEFLFSDAVEDSVSTKGIKRRKPFSSTLAFAFRCSSAWKLRIISKEPLPKINAKGRIYVFNHRQPDDVLFSCSLVDQGGFMVIGNKYSILEELTAFTAWMHGVIAVDRSRKENRAAAYQKMKFVLEHGGNIILFPEGYLNILDDGLTKAGIGADGHNSETWLIQDFNIGVFRLAQETGCEIVPTIFHYDEIGKKTCYAKRSSPIKVQNDDDLFRKKDELMDIMRGELYELMETYSAYKREVLEQNGVSIKTQWEIVIAEILDYFEIKRLSYRLNMDEDRLVGKAPVKSPILPNEEAFEHLQNLNYTKENVFLLSKRNTG